MSRRLFRGLVGQSAPVFGVLIQHAAEEGDLEDLGENKRDDGRELDEDVERGATGVFQWVTDGVADNRGLVDAISTVLFWMVLPLDLERLLNLSGLRLATTVK